VVSVRRPTTLLATAGPALEAVLDQDAGLALLRYEVSGRTLLHHAAATGAVVAARALLARGADAGARAAAGDTPLALALRNLHGDVAQLLLELPDCDCNARDSAGAAATRPKPARTTVALARTTRLNNTKNTNTPRELDTYPPVRAGMPPLLAALVDALLANAKADIGAADVHGNNALHHVAALASGVRALLSGGREPPTQTSVEAAIKEGAYAVVCQEGAGVPLALGVIVSVHSISSSSSSSSCKVRAMGSLGETTVPERALRVPTGGELLAAMAMTVRAYLAYAARARFVGTFADIRHPPISSCIPPPCRAMTCRHSFLALAATN